jgi:hypothetical protein
MTDDQMMGCGGHGRGEPGEAFGRKDGAQPRGRRVNSISCSLWKKSEKRLRLELRADTLFSRTAIVAPGGWATV